MSKTNLTGYWKLDGDCRDSSGNANHGVNHGADFAVKDGARFDGRAAFVEIPASPSLHFGKGDFSIAAWVHTEKELDDTLGDIAGKYDPDARKGLNFCIQNFHGVTSCQSNYRNVLFGIDDARLDDVWADRGRPGNNLMVWALCVYDGALYAGTFETGKDEAGHVYRYDGGTAWTDCGSPDPSNCISSLAVFEGRLYAASSLYRSGGSALSGSENTAPGGRVYCYEGGLDWTDCGKLGEISAIGGMAVYKGALYASSMYAPAGLFRYKGGSDWTDCGNPDGRIESLCLYDGHLYGSGWDAGRSGVYRYEGGRAWADCGTPPGTTQTYGFAIHRGRLYASTWPSGKVFRYAGGTAWEECGQLGNENEVMGMAVYNGKLYAGTLPLADVHRYDGDGNWTRTGQLDTTPNVKYRRAWSMAVFDGKLFCGTLPSGRVRSIEAGKSVTYDRELGAGWQHLAAIKEGGQLKLYVNGALAAVSGRFDPADFDVSNDKPLTIGFGAHDYFNGGIKDVRVYDGALTESEAGVAMREGRTG